MMIKLNIAGKDIELTENELLKLSDEIRLAITQFHLRVGGKNQPIMLGAYIDNSRWSNNKEREMINGLYPCDF